MNKTKIEYGDYAWNPIIGCKGINCSVGNRCWAKRMNDRFHFVSNFRKPRFLYKRLSQPLHLKKPSIILTCFMSDFWGRGVKQIWREEIYNVIKACPEHTFLLLTKQPQNITPDDIDHCPENVWLGVSITKFNERWRIAKLVSLHLANFKFVSLEPILDDCISEYIYLVDWIIVGAMTEASSKKHLPTKARLKELLTNADRLKIPVFMKNNLKDVWKAKLRQEFPVLKTVKTKEGL